MINYLAFHNSFTFSINIIFLFVFIFLNLMVPLQISKKYKLHYKIPVSIILANFIFFSIFYFLETIIGGDGRSNYYHGFTRLNQMFCFVDDTCLREIFIKKIALTLMDLNINYYNSILFLNLLSCTGLLLFYIKVSKFYIFKNFYIFMIFFLTSFSGMVYWSNSFLKDNFILFAIILFLYSIRYNSLNFKILFISIVICFLIRPLPGYFILLSVTIYYLIDIFIYERKKFKIILPTFLLFLIPSTMFVFNTYSIDFNFNVIGNIIAKINIVSSHYSQYANESLTYGTKNQLFITKLFYHYFMPIKISSPIIGILSIQNIFILLIFITFFRLVFNDFKIFLKFIKKIRYENIFFIYLFFYTLIVPGTGMNSGIDLRIKWMALIIFFYLATKFFSYWLEERNRDKKS